MKHLFPVLLTFSLFSNNLLSQSNSPTSLYIKVDQFGYTPNSLKVAVISNPELGSNSMLSFTPANTLELRNWFTDSLVYSGAPTIWNNGDVHEQSGDAGWWFDFSSVTAEGDYYIYDPISNVRSHRFKIDDDTYNQVLKSSVLMFYRNRIGNTKPAAFNGSKWVDNAVNFTQDQQTRDLFDRSNTAQYKDLSGGWADAGDYNKYVTFTNTVIHDLLWAYQENPTVFGDNWNIPESNNNLPDILDEIKWELDWLMKMNNADGSTHIKMGSLNHQDNSNSLPSQNNDPRYYGPTCSSAEIVTAGMFAHAALVLSQFPSQNAYVSELTSRAEQTWLHVLPQLNNPTTLDIDCDLADSDNRIVSGDADISLEEQIDMGLKAAIYLWDLTGKNTYKNYIDDNLYDTEPLNFFWNMYRRPLNDALLHYSNLSGVSTADRNAIRNSYQSELGNHLYFGMSNEDLYRSYMPNNQYHWGSNQPKAVIGIMNLLANNYNIDPVNAADYRNKAAEHVHYFHGLNGLGITYLTNMYALGAEYPANEMYHQWFGDTDLYDNSISSPSGPAPGYVTGGPNFFTSVEISPPASQPMHKSYLDYNTVENKSWEITEPAIYYQSAYVRLLAAFCNAPAPCLAENLACNDGNPKTTNDRTDGFCGCIGDCPSAGTPCNDNDPLTSNDRENGACLCIGEVGPNEGESEDCQNQVSNGDFSNGTIGWGNWGSDMNVVNGQLQLTNVEIGDAIWDGGLNTTTGINLETGKDYVLTFNAAASADRTLFLLIGVGNSSLYNDANLSLTTTMTEYSVIFTNTLPTTDEADIRLFTGGDSPDVFLDDFSITELDCDDGCDEELLSNGGFDDGVAPFFNWGSTLDIVNGQAIISDITGPNPWDAALAQHDLTLETSITYTISFDARANSNRLMYLKLGLSDANFTILLYEEIALTTSMQNFSFDYTMTGPTSNLVTLELFCGNDTPNVTFDNVSITGECQDIGDDCEFDVIVTSPITKNLYQAENSVSSSAIISQTSPVEFGAYNFIQLDNGFEVSNGIIFSATLDGCNQ